MTQHCTTFDNGNYMVQEHTWTVRIFGEEPRTFTRRIAAENFALDRYPTLRRGQKLEIIENAEVAFFLAHAGKRGDK